MSVISQDTIPGAWEIAVNKTDHPAHWELLIWSIQYLILIVSYYFMLCFSVFKAFCTLILLIGVYVCVC